MPIDILSLSFWIAEGIIGVTLFLIFIFHVKMCIRDRYYTGKDKGVALKIKECKQYKEAVDPTTVIANFKVPQSFIKLSIGQLEESPILRVQANLLFQDVYKRQAFTIPRL